MYLAYGKTGFSEILPHTLGTLITGLHPVALSVSSRRVNSQLVGTSTCMQMAKTVGAKLAWVLTRRKLDTKALQEWHNFKEKDGGQRATFSSRGAVEALRWVKLGFLPNV